MQVPFSLGFDGAATDRILRTDFVDDSGDRHPALAQGSLASPENQDDSLGNEPVGQVSHAWIDGSSTGMSILAAPGCLMGATGRRISRESSNIYKAIKKSKGWYPLRSQLRKIFFGSLLHVLLLLIPAGLALHYTRRNPVAIFFVNFAAMVPSIMIMALAIDSIVIYVGDLLGVLIATTFSNSALLITSVLLLRSGQIGVLRISIMGSILSNLLLMPGLAFLIGGLNRVEQYYNVTVAKTAGEMLLLAIFGLMVPSAAHTMTFMTHDEIVKISRGTAIFLLICYGSLVYFQLRTHTEVFSTPSQKAARITLKIERGDMTRKLVNIGAQRAAFIASPGLMVHEVGACRDVEDAELPLLTAIITLTVFTVLLSFNTLLATDSIQALLLRLDLTETFLGIVVLPIISNDPGTILVAVKDRQDMMLGLTLGRCVQIALFVFPAIVLLAWMLGIDELSLGFNSFQTILVITGVLVVNYITHNGKSHWLVGALLVSNYVIIAVSAYYWT